MPRQPTFTTSIRTPWMLAGMACLGACTFVVMDAIRARDAEAIRHLLQQGTNPHPWDWAVPPYEAISRSEGDARIVELLMTYGTAPNALTKWAITPLLLARQEMVEVLCRHGARDFLCSRQRHALQSDSQHPNDVSFAAVSGTMPDPWNIPESKDVEPLLAVPTTSGSCSLGKGAQTSRLRGKPSCMGQKS